MLKKKTNLRIALFLGVCLFAPGSSQASDTVPDGFQKFWDQFRSDAEKAKEELTRVWEGKPPVAPSATPTPEPTQILSAPVPVPLPENLPERNSNPLPFDRELARILESLSEVRAPLRDVPEHETCAGTVSAGALENLEVCLDSRYPGFSIKNTGSPRINPKGGGILRSYSFLAPDHARREIELYIHEQSLPDGPDSAISMETEIVFIPRRVLPALKIDEGRELYEVTLPTGEVVSFDMRTNEIVSGPLEETGPIDSNPNRQTRKFAALRYNGNGIMIRSDQRGETPRGGTVWGQKKKATITYRGKSCQVPVAQLWDQSSIDSGSAPFLFDTDEAFAEFARKQCGWNVTL